MVCDLYLKKAVIFFKRRLFPNVCYESIGNMRILSIINCITIMAVNY